MKILFRKIDSMKYYKGVTLDDIPRKNGVFLKYKAIYKDEPVKSGKQAKQQGMLCEEILDEEATNAKLVEQMADKYYVEDYIFAPITLEATGKEVCAVPLRAIGLGGTPSYKVAEDTCRNDSCFDDVLIIWCAARDKGAYRIVGWHKNCVVRGKNFAVTYADGAKRHCKAYCKVEDAVMLPYQIRGLLDWEVPFIKTHGYGFSPTMAFDMENPYTKAYVEKLLYTIEKYEPVEG